MFLLHGRFFFPVSEDLFFILIRKKTERVESPNAPKDQPNTLKDETPSISKNTAEEENVSLAFLTEHFPTENANKGNTTDDDKLMSNDTIDQNKPTNPNISNPPMIPKEITNTSDSNAPNTIKFPKPNIDVVNEHMPNPTMFSNQNTTLRNKYPDIFQKQKQFRMSKKLCLFCRRKFTDNEKKAHWNAEHPDKLKELKFACTQCDDYLSPKTCYIIQHFFNNHLEPKQTCPVCHDKCPTIISLSRHITVKHQGFKMFKAFDTSSL